MKLKKISKKLFYISGCGLILFLSIYFCGQYEKAKIKEFEKKTELIKIGMTESEVEKILGKPDYECWVEIADFLHLWGNFYRISDYEWWVETARMREEIQRKYKKLYEITYFCKTPSLIIFKRGGFYREIYLDKKGGKVVYIGPIYIWL